MAEPLTKGRTGFEPEHSASEQENSPVEGDLNLRIIRSLSWFVEDTYGLEKLDSLSWEAGLSPEQLRTCRGWISLEQAECIMNRIHSWVGSDQAFMDACVYRMRESYGPLRFLLWATSPSRMLELGQRHFGSISSFSRGDFEKLDNNRFRLRYHSNRKESRLLCLSRQAQSEALPGLWDLPPASITETACLCRGDDFCEYVLSVYEKSRWLPVVAGGMAGILAALLITLFQLAPFLLSVFLWGVTPLLGATLGYVGELRRANRRNLIVADDINRGLSQLVVENQEAHHEILKLHQRQRDWSRRLEDQVAERVRASDQVSKRLQTIIAERSSVLQGVSHDMKNPLTVILQTSEILRDKLSADSIWLVEEQMNAVERMRSLLDDVLTIESSDLSAMQFLPEPVESRPLEDSLRRRLRALVGEKNLRVSVLATRETPERILVDRMVMDRVIDNLLTNAVKYTDRGSIVLELDGKPGFLTIKLSDTGRGIAESDIEMIFQAGGSDPGNRKGNSHGLGLSVVVRLLDQIGGRLEVMSLPGRGSTFWVHFPVEPPGEPEDREQSEADRIAAADRVVTIRRVV